ncbi:MAG: 2,3-dihydroxybiphenyl 1,2-dioxygenase [Deltaproteobacteria bacterium]|nr:2,3-dihydroxybiphenyl 1,2-dioxygenase [Deltaproteobacteria bacterium]
MAKLVEIIGITHNPFLPRLIKAPNPDPVIVKTAKDYDWLRQKMAQARPDVLIVVASDHLNQWFMDNMPAFLVGKAPSTEGPAPVEIRAFGLAPYRAKIDTDMAKGIIREGSRLGVDFAFSDECFIDHAFTVPLNFVRPEMDLPIVPIWTNVMAQPLPTSQRFYDVGRRIREAVEALPDGTRVGVLSSGHLAVEIGGPKTSDYSSDTEFDRRMMDLISAGDAQTVIQEATYKRLIKAGNVTPGFLNYILLMGIAGGTKPTATGLDFPEVTAAMHYMHWEIDGGGAA